MKNMWMDGPAFAIFEEVDPSIQEAVPQVIEDEDFVEFDYDDITQPGWPVREHYGD